MRWVLDHLRMIEPDGEKLLRDIALGGEQAYEMWAANDLRDTFGFRLERYGLLRFVGDRPALTWNLVAETLQKPSSSDFDDQKRQLKVLVDELEAAVRARISTDVSSSRSASDSVHAIVNAIPSDSRNRPLARQELLDLGEARGLAALLEALNWGDYEILLNKLYGEIRWSAPDVAQNERLAALKSVFARAHLVRHNNDSELRAVIATTGFAAFFGRICEVRDMLSAPRNGNGG
jgi:hypothetical protein